MYNKNLRKERAAAGLCTNCGGTLDTDGRMCSACREKYRTKKAESVQWYRSNGICPLCKKEKIFGDENTCPECRVRKTSYNALRQEKMTEGQKMQVCAMKRNRSKARYHRLKEAGLCVRCGKRKSLENLTACNICRTKYNSYHDAQYWAKKKDGIARYERAAYGLCYICGRPLDREGKTCKACSERAAAVLSKNRGSTNVNVYWKADNKLIFNKKLNVT